MVKESVDLWSCSAAGLQGGASTSCARRGGAGSGDGGRGRGTDWPATASAAPSAPPSATVPPRRWDTRGHPSVTDPEAPPGRYFPGLARTPRRLSARHPRCVQQPTSRVSPARRVDTSCARSGCEGISKKPGSRVARARRRSSRASGRAARLRPLMDRPVAQRFLRRLVRTTEPGSTAESLRHRDPGGRPCPGWFVGRDTR